MAMAPEEYVVQSAVRYFFHNWICGLRPSLSLETANDGTLSIHASVQCSPFKQPINSTCDAPRRKRSGRGSRKSRELLNQVVHQVISLLQKLQCLNP